ncbi:MAG: serine hydrolase domain-containing protein [Bacteroidia bacterium]
MLKKGLLIAFGLTLVGLVIIGGSIFAPIGTGYSAKIMCSCVFVSARTPASVEAKDLSAYWYVNNTVDQAQKSVSSRLLFWEQTAVYREGLGCTLLHDKDPKDLADAAITQTKSRSLQGAILQDYQDSLSLHIDQDKLAAAIDYAFVEDASPDAPQKNTRAVVVLYDSIVLAERYGPGFDAETPLLGWSMAKSVTQAQIGLLVKDGKLDIHAPAPVPEWQGADDPRRKITLDQMLRMSSGLDFEEVYFPPADATTMLFEESSAADYAAQSELGYEPDSRWNYSSATSNLLARIVRQSLGDDTRYLNFVHERLFQPLQMTSAVMEPDASGTYVGSSFMYATGRDWAKFGLLYLRDGVWRGQRILAEGWVDYTRTPTPKSDLGCYGAQFWLNAGNEEGRRFPALPNDLYYPSGYEGQHVFIIPSYNMIIVRLGFTPVRDAFDIETFVGGILEAVE